MNANIEYLDSNRTYAANSSPAIVQDILPEVPVLPETLLALDLHRHEFSFDLRGISLVVLEDPGATLQILRLAGREYGDLTGHHLRIEDCICDLGLDACLRALERGALARPRNWRALLAAWEHARTIARCARLIAEQKPIDINPDHAYIGGLLHGLGILPELLEWTRREFRTHPAFVALHLAQRWSLPAYLSDLFCDGLMPGCDQRWSQIMADAHRLAGISSISCPFGYTPKSSLAFEVSTTTPARF